MLMVHGRSAYPNSTGNISRQPTSRFAQLVRDFTCRKYIFHNRANKNFTGFGWKDASFCPHAAKNVMGRGSRPGHATVSTSRHLAASPSSSFSINDIQPRKPRHVARCSANTTAALQGRITSHAKGIKDNFSDVLWIQVSCSYKASLF